MKKLTEKEVTEIKRLYNSGVPISKISIKLNISVNTIKKYIPQTQPIPSQSKSDVRCMMELAFAIEDLRKEGKLAQSEINKRYIFQNDKGEDFTEEEVELILTASEKYHKYSEDEINKEINTIGRYHMVVNLRGF